MCKVNNNLPIHPQVDPRLLQHKKAERSLAIITAIVILAIATCISIFFLGFDNTLGGQIVAWSCVGVTILALYLGKSKIKQL